MEYLQYAYNRYKLLQSVAEVLNLVISGIPSIQSYELLLLCRYRLVLNLVISGIPSIQNLKKMVLDILKGFKPCYKWNTFNTQYINRSSYAYKRFKPCYKWNTFNTCINRLDTRWVIVLNLVISGIPSILWTCGAYKLFWIKF